MAMNGLDRLDVLGIDWIGLDVLGMDWIDWTQCDVIVCIEFKRVYWNCVDYDYVVLCGVECLNFGGVRGSNQM